MSDYRWILLGILAIVAFVFAWIGYTEFLNHEYQLKAYDAGPKPADVFYRSIMLFLPATAPDKTELPIWLDIARFLAPAVAGYAALEGLASLFRDRIQQISVPLMHQHVVVCGLGYVGTVFLRHLRESHVKAVAIETDPANPHIELCRSLKIPVIVGDAQLEKTLHAAGVQRAARLVAVCSEDAINAEIVAVGRLLAGGQPHILARIAAVVRRRLVRGRRLDELQCLARIGDPELCALLRIQEANLAPADPASALDFFNTDEIAARMWLDDFPILTGSRPHLLVNRLDELGKWLIRHAARMWYEAPGDAGPLWVSVIDDHPEERVEALVDQYPALESVCRFVYVAMPNREAISDRQLRLLPKRYAEAGAPAVTRAYVAAYRDEDALEAALALRHGLDAGIPLVVALSRAHGVGRLIEDAKANGSLTNIDVFPTLEKVCTTEFVQGGSFELIAVAVHNHWRDDQLAQGANAKDAPTWEQLDESRKDSSRAQARHIPIKLRTIGCAVAPLRDWDASDFAFTDNEIERLALAEHDRWVQERRDAGWSPGAKKDPEKKVTPYLIPFAELPEDIAEIDRMFVRAIPTILAAAGFQVVRLPQPSPGHAAPAHL